MIDLRVKLGALLVLASAWVATAWAQSGAAIRTRTPGVQVIRVIRDPNTGLSWALERDLRNPGGPGRLVPIGQSDGPRSLSAEGAGGQITDLQSANRPTVIFAEPRPFVIRNGDRLVVEEHSAVVDARLEAVALGSAVAGAQLTVRLIVGEKAVQVVALASGRAAFAASARAQ